MNNEITEIKRILEGTNSRITEAKERISEVEDRVVCQDFLVREPRVSVLVSGAGSLLSGMQ